MAKKYTAVIAALNSQYIHSSLAPWCLAAGVRAYCKEDVAHRVAEGTVNEDLMALADRITSDNPDAVALCCYIWNITATRRLIELVKERLPKAVIIIGGPEVAFRPESSLNDIPLADYLISGEGELPVAQLLDSLARGEKGEGIPGVCRRENGELVITEPFFLPDDPPSPYTDDYFASLKGRIAYLETSRGCPYSCAFCLSGRCGGVRYFEVDRAKKEILMLARSGTKTVKFVDRTFNANRPRAKEIIQFILANYGSEIPQGVCFHFEMAGDILDDETIELLNFAPLGAMQAEIGVQSFHGETLEAINRKTDLAKLSHNISRLIDVGNLHIHIDLIAGLPHEDLSIFKRSFDEAFSLCPHMLQLGFLKLLHGSPMREDVQQFPCHFSPDPPYEVLDTPWLSAEELSQLRRVEDALDRLYNSGRFCRTLGYLLKATGMTPFCFFQSFGDFAADKGTAKISLDSYTRLLWDYSTQQKGVDKEKLQDALVCDRLAHRLPARLSWMKGDPGKLKRLIIAVESDLGFRPAKGIERSYALLCVWGAVWADYDGKNPVTGEYELHFYYPNA